MAIAISLLSHLGACSSGTPAPATATTTASSAEPAAAPSAAPSADGSSSAAPGAFIAWTDSPTVAMIPSDPARLQEEGGKPMPVNLVVFQLRKEGPSLHLDHVGENSGTMVPSVVLTLKMEKGKKLAAGMKLEQAVAEDHEGYALEITEWNAKPWDKKGDKTRQELGKASGRVFGLTTSAGKKRWVAGTFKDAVIEQLAD